jgi:hypothetical protein
MRNRRICANCYGEIPIAHELSTSGIARLRQEIQSQRSKTIGDVIREFLQGQRSDEWTRLAMRSGSRSATTSGQPLNRRVPGREHQQLAEHASSRSPERTTLECWSFSFWGSSCALTHITSGALTYARRCYWRLFPETWQDHAVFVR